MKILLTGSSGFIGSHIFNKLSVNHDVYCVDIKKNYDINNLPSFYSSTKFDMIIHCASFCIVRECIKNPALCIETNVDGVNSIFELARTTGCKKVVFFSSSRILYPDYNIYTTSKKYGENICKSYKECYDIDYIIIRPSTVFGENDDTDRLIPRFIKNALTGKDLEIFGDEYKSLDMTYIGDFMEAFTKIISRDENWNQEWDIGTGESVGLVELAGYILNELSHLDKKSKIIFREPESSQPQNTLIDISKLRENDIFILYGWKAGIDRTIKYWMEKESVVK